MKNLNIWIFLAALACSFNAQATAPRITAQLFGEEQKADIVAYQSVDTALAVEIVNAAFNAAGKSPILDVLPSKQLAIYALLNKDAMALIGTVDDVAAGDRKRYEMLTFYLGAKTDSVLILARGSSLRKAFVDGMKKLINSGEYLQMIEKMRGKQPADYVSRIKRLNPGWK